MAEEEETVWVVAPLTTIYINDDRIFHAGDVVTPDDFESWTEFRAMVAAGKVIGQMPPEPGPAPDEKWDGFTIDTALSAESVNPVQNRVVTAAIEAEKSARTLADGEHDAAIASLKQADQSLAESVTAERQRATQAETALGERIGAEETARGEADDALGERIDAIDEKIPPAANAENQLADKAFVNSSIGTNTAYFVGTFESLDALKAYGGDKTNNDYAFVKTTDEAGNTLYNRYKWNNEENDWLFEYTLNNSSFTQSQWNAINSGATEELVKRIKDGNGTEAGLLRLSDAVDGTQGTDDATAATPSAVKKAYDVANAANENAETALNRLSSETAARQEADDALGKRIDETDALMQQLRTTKQDRIPVADTKDELVLADGEIGIAINDGIFYRDGDGLLNVSGKGTGNGVAFTGTAAELEEALRIPEGEDGYIPVNAIVLITDETEELSE